MSLIRSYEVKVIGSGQDSTPWLFDTKGEMLEFLGKLDITSGLCVEIYYGEVKVIYNE